MPVAAGTPLDPHATKAKIEAAASRLFYARGVHAVGVDEIARVAGVSKLTLYRHFGSKEQLVDEVFRNRTARIRAWVTSATERDCSPAERVLAVFEALSRSFAEAHYAGCAVVNAAIDTRGADAVVSQLAADHLDTYREVFAEALTEAGAEAPETLARHLVLLVEGAAVVAAVRPDHQVGEDATAAARALLRAAGVPVDEN